jgi:hypothetical protein
MGPPSLRRRLPALALAGCLALLPTAARALPVASGTHGPAAVREQGRGLPEWRDRRSSIAHLRVGLLATRAATAGGYGVTRVLP